MPGLVIVGLIGLGLGIRSLIIKRSASTKGAVASAETADGAAPVAVPGDEPGFEAPDPDEPLDWEVEHHPFLGYPPEDRTAEEIMIEYPKGKAEYPLDDMVKVPAGDFTMGDDRHPSSKPKQRVFVKAFELDRYEVTNEEYRVFIKETKHKQPALPDEWARHYSWRVQQYPKGTGDHPVTLVSFADAVAYCRWVGKRLPTEAEWEKAARGPGHFNYPWGNKWDGRKSHTVERLLGPLKSEKEYMALADQEDRIMRPFPVGSYPEDVSGFGAYDMHGNVHEWVDAPFEPYDGGPEDASPLYEQRGVVVTRGVSYANRDYAAPLTVRFPYEATMKDTNIGFRCARDL